MKKIIDERKTIKIHPYLYYKLLSTKPSLKESHNSIIARILKEAGYKVKTLKKRLW